MARAASLPPNHTFRIAGTFSCSQFNTNGRPVNNTNTTGLPVFNNSCKSARCVSGISRSVRQLLSPLISEDSPKAATITSDLAATASASSSSSLSVRLSRCRVRPNIVARSSYLASLIRLLPLAVRILALPPTTSFRPSIKEGYLFITAATLHVPGILLRLSAKGPTTAMVPFFARGSTLFSFFKRTKLSEAVLRAIARCSFVKICFLGRVISQYL